MEAEAEKHNEPYSPDITVDFPINEDGFEEEEEGDGLEDTERNGEEQKRLEWRPSTGFSHRAKIIELLKNLHSQEIKIYSDASKEFIKLLKGDSGQAILFELVHLSPKCTELMESFRLHQGKPGMAHIMSLLSTILDHQEGKLKNSPIRKNLDSFARVIAEEKLSDIYSELKSKESRCQSASLNLLASIVRRGTGLASEVAKSFDFKLPVLGTLSGVRKNFARDAKNHRPKHSTRRAFVNFAMSFIESANPRLLRWVLQQREIFSGVLRGIRSDDPETIVHVLSLLINKVLNEEYLIPPGLRSVLFGSVTLEQLSHISGNPLGGADADVAHQVLVMVCTDPLNGLMPGPGLRGNEKRLFDLMKKLKASENPYHKELLLAVVSKSLSVCSAYLNEFPYHLEPRTSSSWFSAITLAADILSSVDIVSMAKFLACNSHEESLQIVFKCIAPQVFARSVLNKGLLHSDDLVRHGSLRLVLELVKLLCALIRAIDDVAVKTQCENEKGQISNNKWVFLKNYIQDEVRAALPDPQVLLKLLSSLSQDNSKNWGAKLKRCSESDNLEVITKKLKTDTVKEDIDIMVGGIDTEIINDESNIGEKKGPKSKSVQQDSGLDRLVIACEIWGVDGQRLVNDEREGLGDLFNSKLLNVLKFYLRAMPASFDGSFDFIKVIPPNPLNLPLSVQESLLSLLIEYVLPSNDLERIPDSMYKHLQPLLNILLHSRAETIKNQAHTLVRAAMISTGAFDQDITEIDVWVFFLPGFCGDGSMDAFGDLDSVVVSFLCDAVSTVGNNLYKYLDLVHGILCGPDRSGDGSPSFSPLVLCILQKCLRLIDSDLSSFKLYQRSVVSLYVCNTLSLILQSQMDTRSLSGLINSVITDKLKDYSPEEMDSKLSLCEWTPLRNLLNFSRKLLSPQNPSPVPSPKTKQFSLSSVLSKAKEIIIKNSGRADDVSSVANSLSHSILCAEIDDIIENFPTLLSLALDHFPNSFFPFLSSVLYLSPNYLVRAASLWPDMVYTGVKMIKGKTVNCNTSGTIAFAKYLSGSPFYTVFTAIMSSSECVDFIRLVEVLDLLKFKLSQGSNSVHNLKFILFWEYQFLLTYVSNPSESVEGICHLCSAVVDFLFDQNFLSNSTNNGSNCMDFVQDLVDFLFNHPILSLFFSKSLSNRDDLLGASLGTFRDFSKENLPLVDRCVLQILTKLYEFLLNLEIRDSNSFSKLDLNAPKLLLDKILSLFKEKFESCTERANLGSLLPFYCFFCNLVRYFSPFELLDLAIWMFSLSPGLCIGSEPTFVCLHIADVAMEMIFERQKIQFDDKSFNLTILQNVHHQIVNFCMDLNLEFGDFFLFKEFERLSRHRRTGFPLCIESSNIIANTPVNLINFCVFPTNKGRAKTLQLIIELSLVHMRIFGRIFSGFLKKENSDFVLSKDDFVNLLPAALSYVESELHKNKGDTVREILDFYSGILLNEFSNWNKFVTRISFEEKYNELSGNGFVSFEDFQGYFSKTLLGNAVTMLSHFLALNANSVTRKQKLEVFDSIYPQSVELLDPDLNETKSSTNIENLRIINKISCKISLSRLLLLDETDGEKGSKKLNRVKQRLINLLVNSFDRIVRNFTKKSDTKSTSGYLEQLFLQSIAHFCVEAKNWSKSLTFFSTFVRTCLIHRFDDPVTLRAIRTICISLSEFSSSPVLEILELVLGHSQFVSALTCNRSIPDSYSTLLQPLPSISKLVNSSFETETCKLSYSNSAAEQTKLELVRLLRVLYHVKNKEQNKCLESESKELVFLLLSIYGASLSEMDLEILHLMHEIETNLGTDWGCIVEMDYLWGSAVTKVREEMKAEHVTESETIEERRRILFRENTPVDSKICVRTVLQFCFDRSSRDEIFSLKNLIEGKHSDDSKAVEGYDLAFILRFAIHSILMGYIEPVEFCRLGLLAITFVSISSPDDELRKLGYESLGRVKNSLESSRKSKESLQIQLLLSYLQNGISEPWQKIPSVIAIFCAEASFVLLDISQTHFFTLSKFLMRSPSVNFKSIPLFHGLFESSSIHFKSDRLWSLQLLYAGLNLNDDAKICKKSNIMENLLGFYSSSVSDPESRILILQIIKKAMKLPLLSHHLLKECGLLSWFSSVLSLHGETLNFDEHFNALKIMELILKVINEILLLRTVTEWLQETAFEQLSQISSYLFRLLSRDSSLLKQNLPLVNSILRVIVSTERLSQKRRIYQPHFTLSLNGLFNICEILDGIIGKNESDPSLTLELGLDAILMSTPSPVLSHQDKLVLIEIVKWAIPVSLQLMSKWRSTTYSLDGTEECRILKLLRWVTASIIIGKISKLSYETGTHFLANKPDVRTVRSLLDSINGEDHDVPEGSRENETLAAMVLYLTQLATSNEDLLPSVVLALSLLLNSSSEQVREYLEKNNGQIANLSSKVRCSAETNPAWRWTYYQPWRDLNFEQTETEQLEEEQSCRKILIIFSNAFGPAMLGLPGLSFDDLACSHWSEKEKDEL